MPAATADQAQSSRSIRRFAVVLWKKAQTLATALLLSCCLSLPALANENTTESSLSIREIDIRFDGQAVIAQPSLTLSLTDSATEAVISGIPITLSIEAEIRRERAWLWDETISTENHEIRISYHPLSRQFLLYQSQIDTYRIFRHLDLVLAALRDPGPIRILVDAPLDANASHYGNIRISLDVAKLPRPLQLPAYLTEDWKLDSGWVTWPIKP